MTPIDDAIGVRDVIGGDTIFTVHIISEPCDVNISKTLSEVVTDTGGGTICFDGTTEDQAPSALLSSFIRRNSF